MKKQIYLLSFVSWMVSCLTLVSVVSADYERTYGLSAGIAVNSKFQTTDVSYSQLTPEVSGYTYYFTGREFIIRPGIRLGYTGTQASDWVSSSMSIEERDFKSGAEVSLLWNRFPIIPAITLGAGSLYRSTRFVTQAPIVASQNSLSGTSFLYYIHSQFSLIFPVNRGQYEFTPFVRYAHLFSDPRVNWYYGLEFSAGF